MTPGPVFKGVVLVILLSLTGAVLSYTVDHELRVWLQPDKHTIRVHDRITVPAALRERAPLTFALARAARVEANEGVQSLAGLPGTTYQRYRVVQPEDGVFEVRYTLPMTDAEAAGDVFLSVSRRWLPVFGDELFRFSMQVEAPADWTVVSQGQREGAERGADNSRVRWRELQPQDDVYLIAGRFFEYRRDTGPVTAMAFLRQDDPALAQKYLAATDHYVALYSELIGPYPYAKFALVENTWDSGYGMPSFTLLGPKVIRLPFIIHTSYPHEVLHNWWGNSVYVDFDGGNWSEGLTAYLADHFLVEQRGRGARYRRDALQKYRNYVTAARDFPLTEFRAKHGEASEAVGYNKTLMFFHMLRRQLGDADFFAGLQKFYADHQFTRAGFEDIRKSMEQVSGATLDAEFAQWITRTGAPALTLSKVDTTATDGGIVVTGELRQTQQDAPFALRVPVRVTLDDGQAVERILDLGDRQLAFEIAVPAVPRQLAVDPEFDLFRQLDPAEVPPTLGAVFGADQLVIVTPSDGNRASARRYRRFADAISYAGRKRRHSDAEPLPESGGIWLLGWDNRHREALEQALAGLDVTLERESIRLAGQQWPAESASVTLAARTTDGRPLLWTHLAPDEDIDAMARRLRHFGRYSHLVFVDGNPVLRDQWPVVDSPLTFEFER